MTPLPIPNLYAIVVPGDSYDIKLDGTIMYKDSLHLAWEADPHPDYEPLHHSLWVSIPEGAELVGSCTQDGPDFDCEPLVENDRVGPSSFMYRSYDRTDAKIFHEQTPKDSFMSALAAAQIYFQNPLGEEPEEIIIETSGREECQVQNPAYFAWQAAQSKVVQKCVIIQVKS